MLFVYSWHLWFPLQLLVLQNVHLMSSDDVVLVYRIVYGTFARYMLVFLVSKC